MASEAIFIGYRRDDTADVAGRVYDALALRFGRNRLFKDVDDIPPGADFGDYIQTILPRCRAALILIGPNWATARDQAGRRRLDDPNDWVRVEIETALQVSDLMVVPVLVNGAQMPHIEELPPSLQPILRRNAAVIRRDPDFRDDLERLAKALRTSVRTGFVDFGSIGIERRSATEPHVVVQREKEESATKRPLIMSVWAVGLVLFSAATVVTNVIAPSDRASILDRALLGITSVGTLLSGLGLWRLKKFALVPYPLTAAAYVFLKLSWPISEADVPFLAFWLVPVVIFLATTLPLRRRMR